jgi:hypothetical protein
MFRALLAHPQEAITNSIWYIACVQCQFAVARLQWVCHSDASELTVAAGRLPVYDAHQCQVQFVTVSLKLTLVVYDGEGLSSSAFDN